MKYAVIDIGSNSVRLMLWADGKTLYKKLLTTRLGAGFDKSGVLSERAMLATQNAVTSFCEEGRAAGAEVYAFATAAVRSAKNGNEFCSVLKESCGVEVDVVSGETEAQIGIAGALGDSDGGIVDIGGASTEVNFQKNGKSVFAVSLPVGAVKLFDICRDKKELLDNTITGVFPMLEGVKTTGALYAIGGTASPLACIKRGLQEYDPCVSGTLIDKDFIKKKAEMLLSMTAEERKRVRGMEEKRADIIAGGAYLLYKIVTRLGVESVIFSDADNLEGYLYKKVLK